MAGYGAQGLDYCSQMKCFLLSVELTCFKLHVKNNAQMQFSDSCNPTFDESECGKQKASVVDISLKNLYFI